MENDGFVAKQRSPTSQTAVFVVMTVLGVLIVASIFLEFVMDKVDLLRVPFSTSEELRARQAARVERYFVQGLSGKGFFSVECPKPDVWGTLKHVDRQRWHRYWESHGWVPFEPQSNCYTNYRQQ